MRPLTDAWRSATARLILIYGGLFALWCVALLGVVQWESSRYLTGVVDQLLVQRMGYLEMTDPQRLPTTIEVASQLDPGKVMWLGLFDAQGRRLAGTVAAIPRGLPIDSQVHALAQGQMHSTSGQSSRLRVLTRRLPNGQLLVLAKTTNTIDGLGSIIRRGLLWGLSLTLIPGLLGGVLLARGPARRIRAIQQATGPIRRGDLSRRLPLSRRGDELDALAAIVNTMLDEIERLMGEVKGVCDNIAHDLRTPLTRLRARLYRAQQQLGELPQAAMVESCLADIDDLLSRFRALLRVSELEDTQRSACFAPVALPQLLEQVYEFYAPVAEDRGQRLRLQLAQDLPLLRGDRQLLFEALANLVANAIKFSPPGAPIELRARVHQGAPRLEVVDAGPGIPADEREAVTRRFYRGDNTRSTPGSGLGLSIVQAIARLHGMVLSIDEAAGGGSCVSLQAGAMACVDEAPTLAG